jgi:hypothetical protein
MTHIPVVDRPPDDAALRRVHIKVINSNDFDITDRYDNVEFLFAPHQPVTIPAEAANHIFGWREGIDRAAMFLHFQKRCGWNTKEFTDGGKAKKYWEKIDIVPVVFRLVEVNAEEEEAEATAKPGDARGAGGRK